jgi:hypothetical protein
MARSPGSKRRFGLTVVFTKQDSRKKEPRAQKRAHCPPYGGSSARKEQPSSEAVTRRSHGGSESSLASNAPRWHFTVRGRSEEHSHAIKREEALTTTDESAIVSECEDHVRLHGGTLSDPGVGQLDSPSVEPN